MIIKNSSIGMESVRTYTSVSQESKHIESGLVTSFNSKLAKIAQKEQSDEVSPEPQNAKQSFDNIFNQMKTDVTSGAYEKRLELSAINKIQSECIQYLMYLLLGIKPDCYNLVNATEKTPDNTAATSTSASAPIYLVTTESSYQMYAEQEDTSFSTTGTVVTADGRELSINLDLSMSRSFASYYEHTVSKAVSFTDPLVINLDSSIADVSDIKIRFDLDCDGTEEEISQLNSGSGYLALDKNNDGIINDGSELFGTASGDGFADLSLYDSDNNGWIDEADDIFEKLKICVINEDGSQSLYSLKEKGVGAIGLANTDTEFSLNNSVTNETNARIRKTGIFLYETGFVGTMQHLDLAQ